MTGYVVFIPDWHPASLNRLLGHWRSAARKKKIDAEILAFYCSKIPKATLKRSLQVEIHISGTGRSPDPDNIQKSLHDGIKRCGVIVDDSATWLEAQQPKIVRKAPRKGTRIYLRDLEEVKP